MVLLSAPQKPGLAVPTREEVLALVDERLDVELTRERFLVVGFEDLLHGRAHSAARDLVLEVRAAPWIERDSQVVRGIADAGRWAIGAFAAALLEKYIVVPPDRLLEHPLATSLRDRVQLRNMRK